MRLPFQLLALAAAILVPAATASSTIRNPIGALSVVQNATIHTHNHRLTALSEFDLSFNIRDDVFVKLHLQPNHEILAEDTVVTYLQPDGSVSRREGIDRLGHKVFKGTTWVQMPSKGQDQWVRAGWARVLVKKDGGEPVFSGAFSVHHDYHHIETRTNYMRTKHDMDPEIELADSEYMVIWRDSDILPNSMGHQELRRTLADNAGSCLADQLGFNSAPDHPVYMAMAARSERSYGFMDFSNMLKRQIDGTTGGNSAGVNLVSTIGNPAGCPTTRKVALVGVATDCTYTAEFDNVQDARENVIQQMNTASGIWEGALNISLGLQSLTISDATCPGTPNAATEWNQACSPNVNISDRLNLFSAWRGNQHDNNSHWTLLSTCNTQSAVGLAWLGQACITGAITTNASSTGNGQSSGGSETVAGANVVIRTPGASEWQVIAHETGHTFGAVHDCTSDACQDTAFVKSQQCCPLDANTCDAGSRYIMNPATTQGVSTFSLCSIGNICSALLRNAVDSQCLSDNRGVTTITGQQCGNGIVEPGEDCDCGGEACSDDSCCDPTTCKFRNGAVCDDSNEDCCSNCQFAAASTVCRASTGDCDPQETCSGNSSTCPTDVIQPDGSGCGNGLQCASGQCTSRDQQCKSVMGSYVQGNDTFACGETGCALFCASPDFGVNQCRGLPQNFLDGTPCSGSGYCQNGQCKGASFGGQVKGWIDDHKALVIGICSAIGGLLLLSILACLFRCCRRRRRQPKRVPGPPAAPPGGWQGWQGPRGQPAMQQHPSQGWANQQHVYASGGNGWAAPPIPPPSHLPRGNSVRYA